jgi:hypothetical protein
MVESNERAPYVRYSISTPVKDKGIAYTIKKSINTFLQAHNFDGHVTDLRASSDQFDAVIELYDNGNYDFNVEALYEHLSTSGKLPTSKSIRPDISTIKIKPLPCGQELRIMQENKNAIGFDKVIIDYIHQIREKEDAIKNKEITINDLQEVLRERQETLSEKDKRLATLEQRLKEATPKQYKDAINAVINGYLRNSLEVFIDLSVDLQDLSDSGNYHLYAESKGRREFSFATYLNIIKAAKFENEAEFETWKQKIAQATTWQETEEAKKLNELKQHYEADQEILKLAETKKVSPEILEMLKTKINQDKEKVENLDIEFKKIQKNFEEQRELYSQVEELKEKYKSFQRVSESSRKRKEVDTELPIIMSVYTQQPGIGLYLPLDDSKSAIEKILRGSFDYALKDKHSSETKRLQLNGGTMLFVNLETKMNTNEVLNEAQKLSDELIQNSMFEALGVRTKVSMICESETKRQKLYSLPA